MNSRSTYVVLARSNSRFVWCSYLLTSVVLVRLAVQTEESTKVELGLLEELELAHVDLKKIVSHKISSSKM